jgi:hypothetical protein
MMHGTTNIKLKPIVFPIFYMNYFPDAARAQPEHVDSNIAHKGVRVQYNHECTVMVFN